jgi:hypothetical protein
VHDPICNHQRIAGMERRQSETGLDRRRGDTATRSSGMILWALLFAAESVVFDLHMLTDVNDGNDRMICLLSCPRCALHLTIRERET